MSQDAYLDGGPATPPHDSVWDILMEGLQKNPDALALVVMHQSRNHLSNLLSKPQEKPSQSHLCLQWTYRDLKEVSLRFAGALESQGVIAGQTMITFVENSVEWAIAYWTAARIGLTFSALDGRMPERKEELRNTVALLKPAIILLQNGDFATAFDDLNVKDCIKLVCVEHEESEKRQWKRLDQLLTFCEKPLGEVANLNLSTSSQPSTIGFTSGTTNKPKGCPRTVATISKASAAFARAGSFDGSTRFLFPTPNFRGICDQATNTCWLGGATVIFSSERFIPDETLKAIIAFRCTHIVMVPAQLYALCRSPLIHEISSDMLKKVYIGGDIVTDNMMRMSRDALKAVWTGPGYGMTEGIGAISWSNEKDVPTTHSGIAGLGRPLPGTRVRICAPGTIETIKRGEKGDLHLSCPPLISNYLENRDEDSFYDDGEGRWLKTGDLALMDEDGVVFILGRTKDIIKYKGIGLGPVVFEGCLNKLPGIESQIIGITHAEYGQVAVAIIKSDDKLDQEAKTKLKNHVMGELGEDHVLAEIYDLQELGMNEWPVNTMGKIVKVDLRNALGEYQRSK